MWPAGADACCTSPLVAPADRAARHQANRWGESEDSDASFWAGNLRHALRSRQTTFSPASIAHVMKHKGSRLAQVPASTVDPKGRGILGDDHQAIGGTTGCDPSFSPVFHSLTRLFSNPSAHLPRSDMLGGRGGGPTYPTIRPAGVLELQKYLDSGFTIRLRPMHNDVNRNLPLL